MKVYGASLSPFVRKVLLTLETKGIAYEMIPVMPNLLPANYEKISPLKKMPVLDHDGFTVPDSSVICAYLDEVFPDVPVYPKDARQRATARFIEEYGDTKLVETVAPFFAEHIVKPLFFKQPPDEARLAAIVKDQLPPVLAYLETVVPENGLLFGAKTPGVADFAIASPFLNGQYGGFEIDGRSFPRLAGYFNRVAAAPVVAQRLEKERADMAALQKAFASR